MLQRTLALIIALLGVVVGFIINLMYSLLHDLARSTGVANDRTHFLWGLIAVFFGLVGSFLALFSPAWGVILLVVVGIAFFFIVGWWALLVAPFLLFAAFLAYKYRRVPQQQMYHPNQ